jgi:hypothetical protein
VVQFLADLDDLRTLLEQQHERVIGVVRLNLLVSGTPFPRVEATNAATPAQRKLTRSKMSVCSKDKAEEPQTE